MLFIYLLVAFALISACYANVIEITNNEAWDRNIDGSSNVLVEFYAPWCGHCKSLAPEYQIAADAFKPEDDVKLLAVDATLATELATTYGVQGFPTLKFFPKGTKTSPEEYNGGRTADQIVSWINGKAGTKRKVKMAPSVVTALTADTFSAVTNGDRGVMVEFYAPWCGHCKSLAPIYEDVAKVFAGDASSVVIAKVDATEEADIGESQKIEGFPTLKWFPKGASAVPVDYQGARTLEGLVDFVNEQMPELQRSYTGELRPKAGRYAPFDAELAAADYKVDDVLAESFKKGLSGLSGSELAHASVYVKIVEKVLAKGVEYLDTEAKRTRKMVAADNIKPADKTRFQLKLNIMKAFASEGSIVA